MGGRGPWAVIATDGAICRSLLSRTAIARDHRRLGIWISLQRGRGTARVYSRAPDAVYHAVRDRHCLVVDQYFGWNLDGTAWLRILVAGCHGNRCSTRVHGVRVANGGLGSRKAASADRPPFHDPFWRHSDLEWPRHVCRYQL